MSLHLWSRTPTNNSVLCASSIVIEKSKNDKNFTHVFPRSSVLHFSIQFVSSILQNNTHPK